MRHEPKQRDLVEMLRVTGDMAEVLGCDAIAESCREMADAADLSGHMRWVGKSGAWASHTRSSSRLLRYRVRQ